MIETIHRIICPFCLQTASTKMKSFRTRNYTVYLVHYGDWYTRTRTDSVHPKEALDYERKELQLHLPNCSMKDVIGPGVLEHYKLNKN